MVLHMDGWIQLGSTAARIEIARDLFFYPIGVCFPCLTEQLYASSRPGNPLAPVIYHHKCPHSVVFKFLMNYTMIGILFYYITATLNYDSILNFSRL
jgi:hypothetical protein